MKVPTEGYSHVDARGVIHQCSAPYTITLLAKVAYEDGREEIKEIEYVGYTAVVNEKLAFDLFGRQIEFASEIEKILEVTASNSKTDCFIVQLADGMMSWAEVRHTYTYGMGVTLPPGEFIPPARFGMRAVLSPVGVACESIEPLQNNMRVGIFATHVGKKGTEYYLLEKRTGAPINFPIDWGTQQASNSSVAPEEPTLLVDIMIDKGLLSEDVETNRPNMRIKTFCSPPVLKDGKLYIDAEVEGNIEHFVIDPNYHKGCRLQVAMAT